MTVWGGKVKISELVRDRQSGWPFQWYVATCELASLSGVSVVVVVVFFPRLFFLYLKFDSISYGSGGALKTRLTPRVCQWICGVSACGVL